MVLGIALLVLGFLLILVGIIGSVAPILPGPPIAWIGLLVGFFSKFVQIPIWILVFCAILMIGVTVADNIFPSIMTKKSGGTKAGSIGATVGLIAGFFLGIAGILLGPFVGAFVFEFFADRKNVKRAFKSALGAFLGFLLGTGIKLLCGVVFLWILIHSTDFASIKNQNKMPESQTIQSEVLEK